MEKLSSKLRSPLAIAVFAVLTTGCNNTSPVMKAETESLDSSTTAPWQPPSLDVFPSEIVSACQDIQHKFTVGHDAISLINSSIYPKVDKIEKAKIVKELLETQVSETNSPQNLEALQGEIDMRAKKIQTIEAGIALSKITKEALAKSLEDVVAEYETKECPKITYNIDALTREAFMKNLLLVDFTPHQELGYPTRTD